VSVARRTTTRDRLVATAGELFWRQGYAATGVNEIITQANATSGSFYHFFSTKDELLVAVVESVADRLEAEVLGPAETGAVEPAERLGFVIDAYRRAAVDRVDGYGLPIGALVGELGTGNEPARSAITGLFDAVVARVATWIGGPARRPTAVLMIAALEGAATMAKARRSAEPVDRCTEQLRRMIEPAGDANVGHEDEWRPRPAKPASAGDWKAW
jgi:TetR/AcrR family transcriptional repressor of lmrAB and yxaGH operons